jgi:hypothetical protein
MSSIDHVLNEVNPKRIEAINQLASAAVVKIEDKKKIEHDQAVAAQKQIEISRRYDETVMPVYNAQGKLPKEVKMPSKDYKPLDIYV